MQTGLTAPTGGGAGWPTGGGICATAVPLASSAATAAAAPYRLERATAAPRFEPSIGSCAAASQAAQIRPK
jgi:hypothetical protein